MVRKCSMSLLVVCFGLTLVDSLRAQPEGRIFLPIDDVIGIWEFNDLDVDILEPILDDTIIPDLSGNGLDAVVVDNLGGDLVAQEGDLNFGENTGIERAGGGGAARVTIEDDDDAFEFDEQQDFTFEMYVTRAEVVGGAQWGILGGTWHSRTADGAFYGWGFIQRGGQPGWLLVVSPTNLDGTAGPLGCCPNEKRNDASWEITAGSHYIVASFDRVLQVASVYLDGELVETLDLFPEWSFLTPDGYEHANLTFLTGIDDTARGSFRPPPTGYSVDAARISGRIMEADEVMENWLNISDGIAVPPSRATGQLLVPADVNLDGTHNITDAVLELNFLFSSGELAECLVVPGSDQLTDTGLAVLDYNGDGTPNITDAVGSLNFLFGGGDAPALGTVCTRIEDDCEATCQN